MLENNNNVVLVGGSKQNHQQFHPGQQKIRDPLRVT